MPRKRVVPASFFVFRPDVNDSGSDFRIAKRVVSVWCGKVRKSAPRGMFKTPLSVAFFREWEGGNALSRRGVFNVGETEMATSPIRFCDRGETSERYRPC